ncbi:hypothetical protein EBP82_21490 [Escherichia coli O113]|nr:hypothetical protein [Escherichia coli O113]
MKTPLPPVLRAALYRRAVACALLEDLMESGPLKVAPSLSFLGLVVMDELCARHIKAPVLH